MMMNILKKIYYWCMQNKNETSQNYKILLETIQDGLFVIQDEKFVYVNDSFVSIVGTPREELLGSYFLKNIHPDDSIKMKKYNVDRLDGKKDIPSEYEFRVIDPNGSLKYINMTVGIGLYKGKPATMGTIRNFTKKHSYDVKLNTLQNAVIHSPAGIVITNKDGVVEYINPKFTEITGYTDEEIIGNTPRLLKSNYHDEEFYIHMWDTLLSGKVWKSEIRNKRKNGTLYWEKQSISPIFNNKKEITHFVGVKEDITELKKLHVNLVKAKEKAEESDKLKTSFLASMSHEIRSPMNVIIGFTDLLRDDDMKSEERNKYIDYISRAGDTLLNLIDDIIDIAKIESEQLTIRNDVCNLSELMDDLYKTQLDYKNRNNKINVDLIPNGDNVTEQLVIKTDPYRLRQIMTKLIGNAIKFTEDGYVKFGYLNVSDDLLQFYVKDTGIGIPEEETPYVFDRFRRVENDEKIYSGTGLGLAITKNLVKLLGGDVWLESMDGVGSIFYFTLPYEKISKTKKKIIKKEKKEIYNWEGKTILIAEDEKLNYSYLSEVLSKTNVKLIWAKTGKHAVNLYRKHKGRINLILMDIKMPIMSGYDAMKIIRRNDTEVPIIVQTAHVISGERDKSFEAGACEYLTKPIKYYKLFTTIHKHISYDPKNKDK